MGALFVVKYGSRVSPYAGVLAVFYAAFFLAAVSYAQRPVARRALGWAAVGIALGALALTLSSPEANRVARLPALAVWLDRLWAGTYPYASPVRPSGFPGLYALAFPFWATASLRLLPVVGLGVFMVATLRNAGGRGAAVLVGLALLPTVWYEVAVHSELLLNMALALASLWAFERARHSGHAALAGAAALAGVLLSTRLVVGVVYAVWGAYAFREHWGRGLAFAGIALAVWSATWLPFALWDGAQFAALGPFSIQGLYLPSGVVLAGGVAALALGWRAPSLPSVIARTGWLLFVLVSIAFGISIARLGFETALGDGFDLSYFILPTPFLLFTLGLSDRIVSEPRAPEP